MINAPFNSEGAFFCVDTFYLPAIVISNSKGNTMCQCQNFKCLKTFQVAELLKHIRDNQYFMGEKLHHSVQWSDAERDFFANHYKQVCHDLRLEYCNNHCSVQDCSLREAFNKKG
jgi:hypothetical protein